MYYDFYRSELREIGFKVMQAILRTRWEEKKHEFHIDYNDFHFIDQLARTKELHIVTYQILIID